MSIEKSLYQAPVGIAEEMLNAPPEIEIEIEDPEAVTIGIDGVEIEIEKEKPSDEDFDANLAEYMDEGDLAQLAGNLIS